MLIAEAEPDLQELLVISSGPFTAFGKLKCVSIFPVFKKLCLIFFLGIF